MFTKIVLVAVFAAIFCQLSQQKTVQSVKTAPDFSGCDDTYQCVGLPDKCLNKEEPDCLVLAKTQPLEDGTVEFILIWDRPSNSNDSWVGAALSSDKMMGDDSATLFIIDTNGTVQTEEALTKVEKGKGGSVIPEQVKGIAIKKHKYANGKLTAQWERDIKTTVGNLSFDMKANLYHVLLAYGPVKDGKIMHHTDAYVSGALNLTAEVKVSTSTVKPTTARPTGSTGQTGNTTVTIAPTHPTGNTTVTGTAATGNSTATPSNTTTTTTRPKTTGHPHVTTHAPGSASAITMSLFLSIFVAILLFVN